MIYIKNILITILVLTLVKLIFGQTTYHFYNIVFAPYLLGIHLFFTSFLHEFYLIFIWILLVIYSLFTRYLQNHLVYFDGIIFNRLPLNNE